MNEPGTATPNNHCPRPGATRPPDLQPFCKWRLARHVSYDEYVWVIAHGPGSLVRFTVWDGAVRSGDTRIWAPIGTGPDLGATWYMNNDIELLESP